MLRYPFYDRRIVLSGRRHEDRASAGKALLQPPPKNLMRAQVAACAAVVVGLESLGVRWRLPSKRSSEVTPALSRSQGSADWLQHRLRSSAAFIGGSANRSIESWKRRSRPTRRVDSIGLPVERLRKNLLLVCRRARGRRWTSVEDDRLSPRVHTSPTDPLHGSSTPRPSQTVIHSQRLFACPQTPRPLRILSADPLFSPVLSSPLGSVRDRRDRIT